VTSADPRARIITVTPAGAELVKRGHEVADGVHQEVLDALPPTCAAGTSLAAILVLGQPAETGTSYQVPPFRLTSFPAAWPGLESATQVYSGCPS